MQKKRKSILTDVERSSTLHRDKHALQTPPNIWTLI